ncbi:MAG: hypothetical protein JWO06_2439 [Bacteroidota bacterium]|nr:hypothetical protein [Bacteroidota bacterium]
MKFRYLPVAFLLLCFASCKKDPDQGNMIAYDFEGVHHTVHVATAYLTLMDFGKNPGKYLIIQTDSGVTPILSFVVRENVTDHNLSTFATLTYPSMLAVPQCTDTISTSTCIGFSMGYFDNANGALGTYLKPDFISQLNVVGASGTPAVLNGTFIGQLVDSAKTITPKLITNGQFLNVAYGKR